MRDGSSKEDHPPHSLGVVKGILFVPMLRFPRQYLGLHFVGSRLCKNSQRIYDSQIQEIQAARQRGEISASEYLKLKLQMQNAHEQREATIVASPD